METQPLPMTIQKPVSDLSSTVSVTVAGNELRGQTGESAGAVQHLILVLNNEESAVTEAEELRGLIEFMDTPLVQSASLVDWQAKLEGRRLEAIFVAADMDQTDTEMFFQAVKNFDPNIPIVMLRRDLE